VEAKAREMYMRDRQKKSGPREPIADDDVTKSEDLRYSFDGS
jgi:hypothetical protein